MSAASNCVYTRPCIVFDCGSQWETWNNSCIPPVRFIQLFRMPLADFTWLGNELCKDLAQDTLGRGQLLSFKLLVGWPLLTGPWKLDIRFLLNQLPQPTFVYSQLDQIRISSQFHKNQPMCDIPNFTPMIPN
ncbi:uncharacterized protein VP01_2003g1 [Puccinia sorghi]|uniref:Uncharacterized protein n=1 Tax=Puccinia sorghi TaxID=27349 RepID=A0A0L6VB82_9BASI|nr:uncharacterized protein VP01_2003g1 [Puccinia sorghi]